MMAEASVTKAIMEEKNPRKRISDFIAPIPPRPARGEIGNGRSRGNDVTSTPRGNNSTYLAGRLKRVRPDIAARIDDYPSIRAAAIDAGIVRVPTPLDILRRAWRQASQEERETFLAEVSALRFQLFDQRGPKPTRGDVDFGEMAVNFGEATGIVRSSCPMWGNCLEHLCRSNLAVNALPRSADLLRVSCY